MKKTNLDNIPDFGEIPILPKVHLEQNDWKDGILVRTPNWLGDAVMAIPAMMQLRKIVPENCGFFALVPPGLFELFKSLNFIDITLPLHKAHSAWSAKDIKKVKLSNPGVALLMNNSLRDAFHLKVAKVPKLFGAAARGRSILLTQSFNFPKIKNKQLNKIHHAGRYLSLSYAFGAPQWDGSLPVFENHKEPEIMSSEIHNLLEVSKLLVVAPGAAYGEAKRWPAENFHKICDHWIANDGEVAVIGTSGEISVANDVTEGLPKEKIHNLAGKTDMQDLLNILKHAEMCVANDSGVMHLSAILGGSGVAIFGSTDPSSTCPVSRKWQIMFEQQDCAPCFSRTCAFGHYNCLRKITPEMVIEKLEIRN
jgi:lipopolysaccharide heptosyltransferase II